MNKEFKVVLIPVEQSPLFLHIPSGKYSVHPEGTPLSKLEGHQQPQQFLILSENIVQAKDWFVHTHQQKVYQVSEVEEDRNILYDTRNILKPLTSHVYPNPHIRKIVASYPKIDNLPEVDITDLQHWIDNGGDEITLEMTYEKPIVKDYPPLTASLPFAGQIQIPKLIGNKVTCVWLDKHSAEVNLVHSILDKQEKEATEERELRHIWKKPEQPTSQPQPEMTEDEFVAITEKWCGIKVPDSPDSIWRYVWRNRNNPDAFKGKTSSMSQSQQVSVEDKATKAWLLQGEFGDEAEPFETFKAGWKAHEQQHEKALEEMYIAGHNNGENLGKIRARREYEQQQATGYSEEDIIIAYGQGSCENPHTPELYDNAKKWLANYKSQTKNK